MQKKPKPLSTRIVIKVSAAFFLLLNFLLFPTEPSITFGVIIFTFILLIQSIKKELRNYEAQTKVTEEDLQKEIHSLQEQLKTAKIQLKDSQHMAHIGSFEYIVEENKFTMSDELYRLLGEKKSKEFTFDELFTFMLHEDATLLKSSIHTAIIRGSRFHHIVKVRHHSGKLIDLQIDGKIRKKRGHSTRLSAICLDVTQQLKDKAVIESLAYYDPLTQLPNRTLFNEKVNEAIAYAKRDGTKVALLFIDLDKFKQINDTMGHDIGDELLKGVALRLKSQLREIDMLSRVGGDEFIIVLPQIKSEADVNAVAQKLKNIMQESWDIKGHLFVTTFSLGASLYPDHTTDKEQLIKYADIAMYYAKEHGRNDYKLFSPELLEKECC